MTEALLAPTFLFRFSVPCLYFDGKWTADGFDLGEEYRLPCFAELQGARVFGEVRAGWNEAGLFFTARVEGKQQTPWCRDSRIEDSDGLRVWIDTRDTHNIHRASRHCHSFAALPGGSGRGLAEPTADQLIINRARENAKPIRPGDLNVAAEKRVDGYLVKLHIPAAAMTGYDTENHDRLGFTYALFDRELGLQTFSVGSEFPFDEDPSLWGTLELVR